MKYYVHYAIIYYWKRIILKIDPQNEATHIQNKNQEHGNITIDLNQLIMCSTVAEGFTY